MEELEMDRLRLDRELDKKMEEFWIESDNLIYNQSYQEAKDLMQQAWKMLPEPKKNITS